MSTTNSVAPGAQQPVTAPLVLPAVKRNGRLRAWLLALIIPVGVLAAWSISAKIAPSVLLPAPWTVVETFVDFAVGGINDDGFSGTLLLHFWASLQRVVEGFGLAAITAIPLGLLIGRSKLAEQLLDPTLQLIRPIPVTAWLPLSIMVFGLGAKAALSLIALACFFPILMNTVLGVRGGDPRLIEAAEMLGCRGPSLFWQVVLPGALPSIFTGLRLSAGIAWVIIVVGEMTGVPMGLGAAIMEARSVSRTDMILVGMIVMGCAGYITDRLIIMASQRLLRWSPQHG
ncbi:MULTISPECIES: ABC transporter permease [unclassified Beijerinckia]|uniref:ABC transporter permease n=1 Tax=unclassified Beijerinckia TaxID=2638183 RepID=UPI00089D9D66|nr:MULTISPECIES: ABC transporter permease [unclassified Beijerinckia]MDH7797732.1 NitT/TauT family transport system permease protein [Beijerinckia sp. GAS462]SEC96672.1 NitT/TauT family transport system permease protein [Beijerinckia sp. 28-YEA-48]